MKEQNRYNILNRPTHGWMQNNTADYLRLVSYAIYGEQATTPNVNNLLGKLWQQYNESGKIESIAFDFKGNLLSKQQGVISSTVLKTALDSYQTYLVDWTGLPSILGTQIFETSSEFDVLNRATKITLPEDVNTDRKEIIPSYNRAGALEKVSYDSTEYVEDIAYNAKGQRLLIAFGNNIMTRYAYDNRTFRLLRQRSEKYVKTQTGNIISYTPQSGTNKQDDAFNFDLVGNILKTIIRVNDCGISGTSLGNDALDRNFEYDPMYRVISADGRESDTQHENDYLYADAPVLGSPNANNVRAYTRQYSFDKLGNIQQLKQLGTDGFTRNFTYNTGVNTLQKVDTATPSLIEAFTYDVCGNQLTAGTTRNYVWNGANQLITYYNQAGSADPTIFAQYDYSGMNRVSKLVRTGTSTNPIYERIIYIDGIFEYHILENGTTYEKNEIHIMDASTGSAPSRVAMVRVGTPFPNDIADAITYNLEDQIGSSSVRLNTSGTVIDREEYYPFGDSSLRTFTKKRYRYVGKEKDLESGLYYYGARYYAAWTCRFISVDKLAANYMQLTPYQNAGNNPINDYDIDGNQGPGTPDTVDIVYPDGNSIKINKNNNGQYEVTQAQLDAIGPFGTNWHDDRSTDSSTIKLKPDGELDVICEKCNHGIDSYVTIKIPKQVAETNQQNSIATNTQVPLTLPIQPVTPTTGIPTAPIGQVNIGNNVIPPGGNLWIGLNAQFGGGNSNLTNQTQIQGAINNIANALIANPNNTFTIFGSVLMRANDNWDSPVPANSALTNRQLATQRTQAIANILIGLGVNPNQITQQLGVNTAQRVNGNFQNNAPVQQQQQNQRTP